MFSKEVSKRRLVSAGGLGPGRGVAEAFTVLELLVVCVLIALLAFLAAPGWSRARGFARGLECRQHLRQWGVATHLYADDHDDRLPPEGVPNPSERHTNSGWYVQLPAQLGLRRYVDEPWRTNARVDPGRTVWLCPANRRRSNGRNLFHYCLNQSVDGTSEADEPVTLNGIAAPAQVVWLFDSKNLPSVGYWGYLATNLHHGGAQILFLDGHSGWYRTSDLWDPETQRARTNHPAVRWFP